MRIIQIVAVDGSGGIGKDNDLPWPRNKDDMKFFKSTTEGHHVVMGRNTWESLPKSFRPLPKRHNHVVSGSLTKGSATEYRPWSKDLTYWRSLKSCIAHLGLVEKVFIIGGASIYKQAAPYTDEIYMTCFKDSYDCDTFFDMSVLDNFQENGIISYGSITVRKYLKHESNSSGGWKW